MSGSISRRQFAESAALSVGSATLAAAISPLAIGEEPPTRGANDKIVVGVMGVNSRGAALTSAFLAQPNVEIGAVCDVDERALTRVVKLVTDKQGRAPAGFKDIRRLLEERSIDALVCAAPNHWHAPATILACAAGKHVYVEKPCSHNPREGELAVEASRKHRRVVQMGSQRRSYPSIIEAIQKLRAGELGRVLYARTWYNNRRPSIGHGKPADSPPWLDWTLWQGPAADRPYQDNVVHYNWHWFWHWGNGELGNNGIHVLDVARWGLGVEYPIRVTSGGGKYRHDDDQETLDTHLTIFDFGGQTISWEGLSWSPYGMANTGFGVSFHGEKGTLVIQDAGYKILDEQNKEIFASPSSG